ncbi:MAG: DegV family protein [Lachnospira sp.]|nr:DegV family protein [Lachnospira sp.]
MSKIAIVTDSNSGITQIEAKEMGVYVVPMPFFIKEKQYLEDISLSQEQFYQILDDDVDVSTSQPAPAYIIDMWDNLLKEYDEIVHIPMSSGLSGSCDTAVGLSADYDGKVVVVDNRRISVTQKQSVEDAIELSNAGKSAAQIKEILETESLESSIYITLATLKYLKKGGRLTPAAAAIGTILNLKPVLQIQGGKLDAYAKVRGFAQAKKVMLDALDKDIHERFKEDYENNAIRLMIAHTQNFEEANELKKVLAEKYPTCEIVSCDPLSLSVSCHIGPGALAVACARKVRY